jgi:hypothetical protein
MSHTKDTVMVNFVCQLDWDMGYLDIWSNIILGVPVRVFLHLSPWTESLRLPCLWRSGLIQPINGWHRTESRPS